MGFFTEAVLPSVRGYRLMSQSLSGWDGVFHKTVEIKGLGKMSSRNPFQGGMGFFTTKAGPETASHAMSQSLSGWDGVFHTFEIFPVRSEEEAVAIPFRVGWGFSHQS